MSLDNRNEKIVQNKYFISLSFVLFTNCNKIIRILFFKIIIFCNNFAFNNKALNNYATAFRYILQIKLEFNRNLTVAIILNLK